MNKTISDFFSLFRRNIILIIVVVAIGNIIHWYSKKNEISFFDYKIEISTNADYYDPTRGVFDAISKDAELENGPLLHLNAVEKQKLAGVSSTSYRNESRYVLQLHAKFKDSTATAGVVNKIVTAIKSDSMLVSICFKKQADIKKIIKEYTYLINKMSNAMDTLSVDERVKLLSLKYQRSNIENSLNKFGTDFSINIPPATELLYTKKDNSVLGYVLATIMFFVIGLVLAIIIEQFKK